MGGKCIPSSVFFFPKRWKPLSEWPQCWTFPYQLLFLPRPWPRIWRQSCTSASWGLQLLSEKSPLVAPCTSLLEQRSSSNPAVLKEEFRWPSPKAHCGFSSKRKTLSVLYTSFWCSRRFSCQLPAFSRSVATGYYFLMSPKLLDFFSGFFTKKNPLQDLQLSWHPSVLTERLCLFFPAVLPSTFLPLLLCQDSLQEWGLYEVIIAWERNVIKSNI